jgi:flavorubredoxin
MSGGSVITLHGGRLTVLANPIELDGRVAWYPGAVRGFTASNSYLLTEGTDTLMVDTGVTVHRDALIDQVREHLPGGGLSIVYTRIAEFAAICNTTALAEQVPVEALYAPFDGALGWVEFRPRADRPPAPAWASGRAPESRVISWEDGVAIGKGGRRLRPIRPPLRLIPSQWHYDDGTKTLFSGDTFTNTWRPMPNGPWLLDDDVSGSEPEAVRDHLLARFWWLASAEFLSDVQRALEDVFTAHEIETIAPGYGCVIDGRAQVERQYQLMQDAIGGLGRRAAA